MKKKTQAEIEKEEERTGVDIDHDDEKGESPEHIAKVKKARKNRFKEWVSQNHPEADWLYQS